MKKSKTPLILAGILLLCVIMGVILVFFLSWTHNASGKQREKYTPYVINLEAISQSPDMTDKEKILSLCDKGEDRDGGTYYTSETLEGYLYNCETLEEIYVSGDGILYVQYLAAELGEHISISYSDEGFERKICYDERTDTAYILQNDTARVYENYLNGFKLF